MLLNPLRMTSLRSQGENMAGHFQIFMSICNRSGKRAREYARFSSPEPLLNTPASLLALSKA